MPRSGARDRRQIFGFIGVGVSENGAGQCFSDKGADRLLSGWVHFTHEVSDDDALVADVCRNAKRKLDRGDRGAEEWFALARGNLIEYMASSEGVRLICGDDEALIGASSDLCRAEAFAASIAISDDGARSLLAFAAAEARAILIANEGALVALAEALYDKRELGAEEIDCAIAEGLRHQDRARRDEWRNVNARAATFKNGT